MRLERGAVTLVVCCGAFRFTSTGRAASAGFFFDDDEERGSAAFCARKWRAILPLLPILRDERGE